MSNNGDAKLNSWRRRLFLPAYSIAESARFTKSHPSTISSWFNREGGFGPALVGREKGKPLSYLQLVEVAFVVTARRDLGVSLAEVRNTRNYFRQRFSVEYPFATLRFKTEGINILLDLQGVEPNQERGRLILGGRAGQLAWADVMGERFLEFDYDTNLDLAVVWHVAGRDSPVIVDPRINFGAPMVSGIPTWAIRGRYEAGENIDDIEDDFDIREPEILAALKFEGVELRAA
jgi:uncharacterized protein (DUF433 family)